MSHTKLPINHSLLKWAREDARLSLEEAAERARITPLKQRGNAPKKTPAERLRSWENGELTISYRQLEKLAKAYRRPVLTFFLSTAPKKKDTITDFRTVQDKMPTSDSPEFRALVRRIKAIHEDLVNLVEEEDIEPVQLINSFTTKKSVYKVASSLRKAINFSFIQQKELRNKNDLLKSLRQHIHDVGIFTIFEGNLGSYHTDIPPDTFRGIAICHPKAPLIVVNPNDSKAGQLFTLIHELTHLGLGLSSISNSDAFDCLRNRNSKEKFCNKVAAEFLVPEQKILDICLSDNQNLLETLEKIATNYKVSEMVIAHRLMDVGKISTKEYNNIYNYLKNRFEMDHQLQRKKGGSPSKNILDRYRLGEKFINTVISGVNNGRISMQDASRILRIKPSRFDKVSL